VEEVIELKMGLYIHH